MLHDLVYDKSISGIKCSIDKKSKSTWIFRILSGCESKTIFHCHVMKTASRTCYVEITHSVGGGDLKNLIACKPMFQYLGFNTVLYQRSMSGPIKQIIIKG